MRIVLVILLMVLSRPAALAETPPVVDVELVLAVDVSWSMDADEQRLQRQGYVDAIRDPEVIATILRGDWGRIAVTYVEWAGVGLNRTVVPWTILESEADAHALAERLSREPLGRMRRTSISWALASGAALFDNGIDGMRRVIDVSGDGPNNMGPLVTLARDRVVAEGITINGLPIMIKRGNPGGFFHIDNLDAYYRECVIGGFGAFTVVVDDAGRFGEAIRRKLLMEIAGRTPPGPARVLPAQFGPNAGEEAVDCAIGEKQWRRWRRMDRW